MKTNKRTFADRNVVAWFFLVSALGLHVFDEALTGFLPFWNQLVNDLRLDYGITVFPTFSFGIWLGGLIGLIIVLYALILLVARGGLGIRLFTIVFGCIMVGNALGHLLGSVFFGRLLPGTWSSPVLLAAAIFVVIQVRKGNWRNTLQ